MLPADVDRDHKPFYHQVILHIKDSGMPQRWYCKYYHSWKNDNLRV